MPELFTSMPTLLCFLGVALIIVEILVLGFSSIFLIFVAMACFTSAGLMAFNLIDTTLITAFVSVALWSFAWSLVLWKPLRQLQQRQQDIDSQPNGFQGIKLYIADDLSPGKAIKQAYSGITWELLLTPDSNETLPKGTEVVVKKSEVGRMYVAKAD